MHPTSKTTLTLEGLAARVKVLEDDKKERELNERRTRDASAHEYSSMLDGAIAQLEPRFESFEKVNATQLALLRAAEVRDRASEAERIRRAARDEMLIEQQRREDIDQAAKDAERKHNIAVWAVVVPIVLAIVGAVSAAIASHH